MLPTSQAALGSEPPATLNTCNPKRSRMPASMAAHRLLGTTASRRSNTPVTPTSHMASAASR